ncbi:MAG TPA: DUF5654 family protein [Patescibacteria group bacterium]|nr:DUF5654 family protein [Patescibacteria group bacterium]
MSTQIHKKVLAQMLTLATSSFGLVAALAWNDLIKGFIEVFVKPYVSKGSGIIAQLIYAVAITVLVVLITWQLAWVQGKLETEK